MVEGYVTRLYRRQDDPETLGLCCSNNCNTLTHVYSKNTSSTSRPRDRPCHVFAKEPSLQGGPKNPHRRRIFCRGTIAFLAGGDRCVAGRQSWLKPSPLQGDQHLQGSPYLVSNELNPPIPPELVLILAVHSATMTCKPRIQKKLAKATFLGLIAVWWLPLGRPPGRSHCSTAYDLRDRVHHCQGMSLLLLSSSSCANR